jgi:hypothetical protein
MTHENNELEKIAKKLDQLIVLMKISTRSSLADLKKQLEKDKMYIRILEITEEPTGYSAICDKLHAELGVAEITAKRKIADLKGMGLLVSERKGREVYYESSGLID